MSDLTVGATSASAERAQRIKARLARRHFNENAFRALGIAAIVLCLGFVAVLFTSILSKGLPAFWQATLHLEVTYDPEVIDVGPAPVREAGQSDAAFRAATLAWQRELALLNWNQIIEAGLRRAAPEAVDVPTRELLAIVETSERHRLRERFAANPELLGQTERVNLLASANVDNWLKGNINRALPDAQQQLPAPTRQLADRFAADGVITNDFAWHIFTNVDSRAAPGSAGLAGAFMGSLYMMLVVILLAVPIGVASAIYLEEFARKSWLTNVIEVNINNLAAVPSIVYGLLGAAVFINYFRLPLSAPLAGGLVLTLMTLPTIIIVTRAALTSVPSSIREAALGIGASKHEMIFHHVLPLAMPSILTGTIIGLAQALGETAPLLLIGMNAFITSPPDGVLEASTALPTQIYIWADSPERGFVARTSAAIIVLLGFLVLMNGIAIFLRQRFERRW